MVDNLVLTGLTMAKQELESHRGQLFSKRRHFIDRRIKVLNELINDLEIFYGPSPKSIDPGV